MSERREWWIAPDLTTGNWRRPIVFTEPDETKVHVREVLPGDDVPQEKWTEVVIELQQMREENERLRRLLGKCVPYILRPYCSSIRLEMIEKIKKEVGEDE